MQILWIFILPLLVALTACDDFNRSVEDKIDFYRSVVLIDTWAELESNMADAPDGAVLGLTTGFAAGGAPLNVTRSRTVTAVPGVSAEITGLRFTVGDGGRLTLGNGMGGRLVINNDSATDSYSTVTVNAGGSFTLRDGAELRKNKKKTIDSSVQGGAVYVEGGDFVMSGGIIEGNTLVSTAAPSFGQGGGVYLASDAVFTMSGGVIRNNNPTNGTSSYGGGVYVAGGAVFTMNGGTISGNTCNGNSGYGGGVFVAKGTPDGGTFEMRGGSVSGGNRAGHSGGGVYVESGGGVYLPGIFTMRGGTVSGNTAGTNGDVFSVPVGQKDERSGGGVYAGGRVTMSGGTIGGNRVENNNQDNPNKIMASGGGVGLASGSFVMTGGVIRGNSAADCGGGVYAASGGASVVFGGAALVAQDNTVFLDNYFGLNPNAFVMAASPLAPPGGLTAVLDAAGTAAGLALVKGYSSTEAGDPLPDYALTSADVGKFRYKQGGSLVPLAYENGGGVIP